MSDLDMDKIGDVGFEDIIERYSNVITKICFYFSSSAIEFNDLRQECLINIWNGMDSFRQASKLSTWIYRVCMNSCITYNRKYRRKVTEIPISHAWDIADSEKSDRSYYTELHTMIQRLSPENKAIILLWLDEKSYEEISEITGLSKSAVGVRVNRIKERLIKMSNDKR